MKRKIIDVDRVLELYKKYGSVNAVIMRTGHGASTIKKILSQNGVEIKKHKPQHWDFKGRPASRV